MLLRAQEALAHKLGTLPKDQPLTDAALKDYMDSFKAPLSPDSVAALSDLFRLDCHLTAAADEALANLGGQCSSENLGSAALDPGSSPGDSAPPPGALVEAAK